MLEHLIEQIEDELKKYHPTIQENFRKRLLVFIKLSKLIQAQSSIDFNVSLIDLINAQTQYEDMVQRLFSVKELNAVTAFMKETPLNQMLIELRGNRVHALSAGLGKHITTLAKKAIQWEADLTACIQTKKANWWEYLTWCAWRCVQVVRDGVTGLAYCLSLQMVITLDYPTLDSVSFFLGQMLLNQVGWNVGRYLNQGLPNYQAASITRRVPQAPSPGTCALLVTFTTNVAVAICSGDYFRRPTWLLCHVVANQCLKKLVDQRINARIVEQDVMTALVVGTRPLQTLLLTETLFIPIYFVVDRLLAEYRLYSQLRQMLIAAEGNEMDIQLFPAPTGLAFWTSFNREAHLSYIQGGFLKSYHCMFEKNQAYFTGQCQPVGNPIALLPACK